MAGVEQLVSHVAVRARILLAIEIAQPQLDSERRQAATKGAIAATWIERDLWQGDTEPGQADRQAGREQGRSCVEISALSFVRTQMESVPFGPKPPLLLGAGLSDGVCLTPGHGGLMPIGGAHRPAPAHTKGVEFRCCSMRLSSL